MMGSRGISSAEQPPLVASARGPSRRYGFACCNCRRRKAKCGGAFPSCGKCAQVHEQCTYNKSPSLAYAVTLQHQVKAYQEHFEQLRAAKDAERDNLLTKPITADQSRGFGTTGVGPSHNIGDPATPWSDAESTSPQEETSIGTDGHVCFYGSSSLYHIAPSDGRPGEPPYRRDRQAGGTRVGVERQDAMAAFLGETPSSLLGDLLNTY